MWSEWWHWAVTGGGGVGAILATLFSLAKAKEKRTQELIAPYSATKRENAWLAEPPPGTFGLTKIGGVLGFFISLGQLLVGDASRYTHAFIVLDDGTVMEAMPSGARIAPLGAVLLRRPLAFSWAIHLTEDQRERIVAEARKCEGVKYGFSAYLYLVLTFFGFKAERLQAYLERNGRMICSQLVDHVYFKAGIELFADGRAPFDVTPGDLANILIEECWPGDDEPGKHSAEYKGAESIQE